jgi:aminopeptidase-like protein
MRSKYGEYPEYHTSLDNLTLITQTGLEGGLNVLKNAIKTIEVNCVPVFTILCEPKLSKRNLYPTLSLKGSADSAKTILDILTFSDGNRDLIEIAELINIPAYEISEYVDQLVELKLLNKALLNPKANNE